MREFGAAVVLALLSGCAYVGEPLPPALKIPERVTDLRAVQRGDKIYVDFTPPATTTEGLTLDKPGEPDLRIGETPVGKVVPVAAWIGQTIEIRARHTGPSGRAAEWSNTARLEVVAPLAPPGELRAEMTPGGARFYWQSVASKFRVFRDGELIGTTTAPPYLDVNASWGATYSYTVQAVQVTGETEAESEVSAAARLEIIDRFPPAAPPQPVAIAGVSSIEIAWERGVEPDLAMYRLYRDGKMVADKLTAPTFSDTTVQSGVRYRYAVTAVDRSGNESPQSIVVEIVFP